MFGQQPLRLKLGGAGDGFIERNAVSLKCYGVPDCAFPKDGYNLSHIFPMHILSIRAQPS
ncbi:hypothetical protein DEV91_11022 [Phyllobacterium brassicacearum]|nr:hypothetical protein DEV91_11022 [Phyllobacterium brassicacearum]